MNNNLTTFIGVYLAWRTGKNPSGIAVAQGNCEGAELICHHANRYSLVEISDIILSLCTDNTVIAVDAPLIINNQTGRRPCETQISEKYGNRHASTHSSNLALTRRPRSGSPPNRGSSSGPYCRNSGNRQNPFQRRSLESNRRSGRSRSVLGPQSAVGLREDMFLAAR